MDRNELLKMYKERQEELKKSREMLNAMAQHRLVLGEPLTDSDLIKQSNNCNEISLQVMKIKEMLEESE